MSSCQVDFVAALDLLNLDQLTVKRIQLYKSDQEKGNDSGNKTDEGEVLQIQASRERRSTTHTACTYATQKTERVELERQYTFAKRSEKLEKQKAVEEISYASYWQIRQERLQVSALSGESKLI